jgi:hypothetical protein
VEKYYKHIYIVILSAILVLIFLYFTGKSKDEKAKENIEKNSLTINNFELSKNVNDSGAHYLIKAKKASFSIDKKSVSMVDCDVSYVTKNSVFNFKAKECLYELEKKLILKNDIKGKYDNYEFETSKNGILEYDLTTEKAKVLNGILMKYLNQSIKADNLYIDKKNEIIIFKSNVEAVYDLS